MARPQKIGIPPGGLAGQALIKSSDNDFEVTWGGPTNGGGGGNNGGGGTIANGFLGRPYAVWSGSGLVFNVYWPVYYIHGVQYTTGSTTITLDAADPTNARIDVIAVDSTGGIKITGTAAASPIKPTVDTLTQLEITEIQIAAAATTPTGITDEDVYKENVEWTGSSNVSGANFNDTTSPFAGTKDTSIGSFTNGQYVKYTDGSTHDISDYTYLKFYVKIKAQFLTSTGWVVTFWNGTTRVSSAFTVINGIYAFSRTDTSGYQLIVIPLSEFTFNSATFDTVYFTLRGNNTSGFYLDNIVLQGGIIAQTSLQNAITTIQTPSGAAVSDQPNDTFVFVGTGISASGKTITFTGGSGGHVIENAGTPLTQRANLNITNGLKAADNTPDTDVKLGGELIENTSITGDSIQLDITIGDGGTDESVVTHSGGIYSVESTELSNGHHGLSFTNTNSAGIASGDATDESGITANSDGTLVINSSFAAFAGAEYDIDYSANYTNRSLVDKEYVDSVSGGSGTVNSGTQYRIAYYATTGTAVSEASAITGARALKSDANGVPTHFDTATEPSLTELSYVKGVTSAIQAQINNINVGNNLFLYYNFY